VSIASIAILEAVLKMGGAGDPPAPVGDPPTGNTTSNVAKRYMMGQLFASQVHRTIVRKVLKADPATALYVGHTGEGEFMKKRVFAPGKTKPWNALTKFATGEELNAKAFAADFQGK
jgi:hypothetical protein